MRAIKLARPGGLENLACVQVDDPGRPGPGELLVRLRASSLNYHDYAVVAGMIPTGEGRIPMSDGAGEVLEVGEGVQGLAPGDAVLTTFFPDWLSGEATSSGFGRVPGDGIDGYARDLVVAPATAFTRAPGGYDHAEAATLTCAGLTAWRALVVNGNIRAGDVVLVQGSGGVSVFALQFAKAMGATVIATSSSEAKLRRLVDLGADFTIDYKANPKWGVLARELTGGRGVDHVVEIGGAGTLPQSVAATRVGGHIALIGILAGLGGEVPTAAIMRNQIRVQGLVVGSRAQQLDMIRAIEANEIRPVIDSRFPLERIADAFRHQASGAHFGKICLDYDLA